MNRKLLGFLFLPYLIILIFSFTRTEKWQSKFVTITKEGSLQYVADEKGNTIPDFSRVGYYNGDKEIPIVNVKKTISPSDDAEQQIQAAIDDLAKQPALLHCPLHAKQFRLFQCECCS